LSKKVASNFAYGANNFGFMYKKYFDQHKFIIFELTIPKNTSIIPLWWNTYRTKADQNITSLNESISGSEEELVLNRFLNVKLIEIKYIPVLDYLKSHEYPGWIKFKNLQNIDPNKKIMLYRLKVDNEPSHRDPTDFEQFNNFKSKLTLKMQQKNFNQFKYISNSIKVNDKKPSKKNVSKKNVSKKNVSKKKVSKKKVSKKKVSKKNVSKNKVSKKKVSKKKVSKKKVSKKKVSKKKVSKKKVSKKKVSKKKVSKKKVSKKKVSKKKVSKKKVSKKKVSKKKVSKKKVSKKKSI
jgi:hypothetical protein